ncbi:MAG: DUF924 family protein [Salaquimonas sp.]
MNKDEVIKFWFNEAKPEQWFKKDSAFDAEIASRFQETVEAAIKGDLDSWKSDDTGQLALIIMLDQFTRNIFRETPKAFKGDEKALAICLESLAEGFLQRNEQNWRYFMLMPMMHSEDLSVQNASLPLFKKYATKNAYGYAEKHRDIIAEYGRFPHRNEILGRTSTQKENEFLTQPGSSF